MGIVTEQQNKNLENHQITKPTNFISIKYHGRISVLLLNDLFVHLNFNSFVMCYVQTFEQIKMDGWIMFNRFHLDFNLIQALWVFSVD